MDDLISIIVPVYNIERYVGLCIESIIHQTYENLEIILVNDGSTDRCRELCDLYARKDSRIQVVHKTNGGLVSARKTGLRKTRGEYITYVDGDDWIEPDFIERLYYSVIRNKADTVCAGYKRDLFSKSVSFANTLPSGVYEGDSLKRLWKTMISMDAFYRPGITTYVWNKLFKRSVLLEPQSLVDDRISIGEDAAVSYPALLKSRRVVLIDNASYHYRQREDSMLKQRSKYSSEALRLLYLRNYLMSWAEKTDPELHISSQIENYILATALMRSGGRLPHNDYSTFESVYYGKDVVIYSAGTFGQQLVNRFKETRHCQIVSWVDDDYWEYRRCCLDVDPVENISHLNFDYVLIAKVDNSDIVSIIRRLLDLGVERKKILTIMVPVEKTLLIERFLDVKAIRAEEDKNTNEVISHA